ncbi:MAG: hypothetical protein M3Y55_02100 [Pseudomonadota bacterium]|nr:hypothetical protein [Pseudomonadota bacterium]MDQ2762381.1 hypothetical protein [Pseudomonadota bacterium]
MFIVRQSPYLSGRPLLVGLQADRSLTLSGNDGRRLRRRRATKTAAIAAPDGTAVATASVATTVADGTAVATGM